MTDRKIEQSDGRGFGRHKLLAIFIEISVHMKKKVTRRGPKFTKIKTLLTRTFELSQYRKSGSQPW